MKLVTWSARFHQKVEEYKKLNKEQGLSFLDSLQCSWEDGGLSITKDQIEDEFSRTVINMSLTTLEVIRIRLEQELSAKKTTDDLLSKYMLKA